MCSLYDKAVDLAVAEEYCPWSTLQISLMLIVPEDFRDKSPDFMLERISPDIPPVPPGNSSEYFHQNSWARLHSLLHPDSVWIWFDKEDLEERYPLGNQHILLKRHFWRWFSFSPCRNILVPWRVCYMCVSTSTKPFIYQTHLCLKTQDTHTHNHTSLVTLNFLNRFQGIRGQPSLHDNGRTPGLGSRGFSNADSPHHTKSPSCCDPSNW